MTQQEKKEILEKQLELLSEVSKTISKPEELSELSKAMVLIANNI